jgi:hypothetical protein
MPLKTLKIIALDVKTYLMRRYPWVQSKLPEGLESSDPELTMWWLRIPNEILYDRC